MRKFYQKINFILFLYLVNVSILAAPLSENHHEHLPTLFSTEDIRALPAVCKSKIEKNPMRNFLPRSQYSDDEVAEFVCAHKDFSGCSDEGKKEILKKVSELRDAKKMSAEDFFSKFQLMAELDLTSFLFSFPETPENFLRNQKEFRVPQEKGEKNIKDYLGRRLYFMSSHMRYELMNLFKSPIDGISCLTELLSHHAYRYPVTLRNNKPSVLDLSLPRGILTNDELLKALKIFSQILNDRSVQLTLRFTLSRGEIYSPKNDDMFQVLKDSVAKFYEVVKTWNLRKDIDLGLDIGSSLTEDQLIVANDPAVKDKVLNNLNAIFQWIMSQDKNGQNLKIHSYEASNGVDHRDGVEEVFYSALYAALLELKTHEKSAEMNFTLGHCHHMVSPLPQFYQYLDKKLPGVSISVDCNLSNHFIFGTSLDELAKTVSYLRAKGVQVSHGADGVGLFTEERTAALTNRLQLLIRKNESLCINSKHSSPARHQILNGNPSVPLSPGLVQTLQRSPDKRPRGVLDNSALSRKIRKTEDH